MKQDCADMRFIEIGGDGTPAEEVSLTDSARSVCDSILSVYRKTGFERPWIGYLAEQDGQLIGTCAFKSPPQNGQVEIAYFTFPGNEGRGIASRMALQLIHIARDAEPEIVIVAQTLPEENASTAILRKLGFVLMGTVNHPEDGGVWEWQWNDQLARPTN